MTSFSFLLRLVVLVGLHGVFATVQTFAQPSVDLSFSASLSKPSEGDVQAIFPQPDGKLFVTGSFNVAGGKARSCVVKLNTDGTLDSTFSGPEFRADEVTSPARIFDIAIQSTGKILVAGEFYEVDGQAKYRLVRLNSDGSLDTTFAAQPLTWVVRDILLTPDDKIIIGGGFQYTDPSGTRNRLVRLNADGTIDTSFSFSPEPTSPVSKIMRQADGKLVIAEGSKVVRYTATGALDPTFGTIQCNQAVVTLNQQADGKILVAGYFTAVNSFPMTGIFRTSVDGVIDPSFSNGAPNSAVLAIDIAPDQTIAVGGSFTIYGAHTRVRAAVLDVNGSVTNFLPAATPSGVFGIAFQPDGKVLLGGAGDPVNNLPLLIRLTSGGSFDTGFNPVMGRNGVGARVMIQPDGKVLAAGQFRGANLLQRYSIARFNGDGSVDTAFTPPTNVEPTVLFSGLDLQPDGKVLVVGRNSVNSGVLWRLNANGTRDIDLFNDLRPRDIRLLSSGQMLVATANNLRRLNSNGTIDSTFVVMVTGDVYRVLVQPDGKILIGGTFVQVNGSNRNSIARLNSNGTVDTSFNPSGGANGKVADIALQADGKVIIAGEFTGVNFDTNRKYLARFNSDGSLDTSFVPTLNAPVYALKLQPDGRLLIGGDMTLVNGVARSRFARLSSNGSIDQTFNISTNDTVLSIELQTDGKIVYAGEFTKTNGVSTVGIGRLLNPATPARTPFDFDGDGRADISVFRSSTNRWYEALSTGPTVEETFGIAGDIITPADFDGDGKTDEAIFRPSSGQWWYKSSVDGSHVANTFGQSGDIPRPSDFDGDGKADLVSFRPSNSTWYRFGSLAGAVPSTPFGITGDQPLVGDFDGDGKSDLAIFRPSNGDWWYSASSAGGSFVNVHWGQNGDIPVPADFDGDGKTDYAVFRSSDGGWYIYNSSNGSFTTTAFGTNGDRPVAADYDGDGRADLAVFRPSTGVWYLLRSTSGFAGYQFGISTDIAIPGALIP